MVRLVRRNDTVTRLRDHLVNTRPRLILCEVVGAISTARWPTPLESPHGDPHRQEVPDIPFVTAQDGTEIFYKDWGSGQPIVFHHGWPLSSDDWDAQMMFFVLRGYRVVGHDRRGHGRSTQTSDGHDMDTYAADAAAVVAHLGLQDAVHVGPSTGGGHERVPCGPWHARGTW